MSIAETQRWLDHLRAVTQQRADAQDMAAAADDAWRLLIRRGVNQGYSVSALADAAGVSRERIYQIRDGRR